MPIMNQSAAEAAVADAPKQTDAEIEESFFGNGDLMSDLDEPPESSEGTKEEAKDDDILGDLDDIERNLNGKEKDNAEEPGVSGDEDDEEEGDEGDDGVEEGGEADEPETDAAEEEVGDDDETITVSKSAMKELLDKYNAALENGGQSPEADQAQEGAQDAAQAATESTPEQQAQDYAKALSEAVQPIQLTDEMAEKFGIQEPEAFNEFFGEVQRGLAAQSMAQIAGQLPAMIINQTSQALPFVMAAHMFIEDNPEWEKHPAIVEAALMESKKANPSASPRALVKDMGKRINISAKKGEALAGKKRPAKKHDARKAVKKGQFNRSARSTGGKKGKKVFGTQEALMSMLDGSPQETDEDISML